MLELRLIKNVVLIYFIRDLYYNSHIDTIVWLRNNFEALIRILCSIFELYLKGIGCAINMKNCVLKIIQMFYNVSIQ